MSTKVKPLGLRLFLEGVEVPVISAQVNVQPDTPATASIQVIPTDMAMHLLPRTLVHLFFLADEGELPETAPTRISAGTSQGADLNRFDANDAQYKLMFVGEVVGFNYGKNPSQRQIVLQCMDLSSYWDSCYQWFADYSVGGGGLTDTSQNFIGAGTSLFDSVSGGHQWVIGEILSSKPRTKAYKDAKGLLGGLIHLLEAIGGVGGKRGFNGVNDFFTIAELRYNLLGMLGAIEEDDTSVRIYNNKAFFSWLRNGMTSMGTLLSFRDIVNHVNRYIYHHIYPNPCALYRKGDDRIATFQVPKEIITDTALGKKIWEDIKKVRTSLSAAFGSLVDAEPRALGVGEVGTGNVPNPQLTLSHLIQASNLTQEVVFNLASVDTDDKDEVRNVMGEVDEIIFAAIDLYKERGLYGGTELTQVRDMNNFAGQLYTFTKSAIDLITDRILSPRARGTKSEFKEIQGTEGARLYNQLFLPEAYFVAPPRCNVIFPDQYYQFSFSRNFLREVSRLSMGAGLGMFTGGRRGAKLFTQSYYAPVIRDMKGRHIFTTSSRGSRILLPHEIHSGIIPKFEWTSGAQRWAKLAKKAGRDRSTRIGYMQRVASFQFYLHRWSARTMSLTGVFNPYLVLGLPALVMDRSLPNPETVAAREQVLGRKWMPMQYLGKIMGYSHSVHQGGGETTVQFTHCRTHRGVDDEFLSTLSVENRGTRKDKKDVYIEVLQLLSTSNTTVKDRDAKRALVKQYLEGKLSMGKRVKGIRKYNGWKVEDIDAPSSSSSQIQLTASQAAELGVDPQDEVVLQRTPLQELVVGATTPVLPREGDQYIERLFNRTVKVLRVPKKITVRLVRYVKVGEPKTQNLSIEQLLTPGWYSNIWTNDKISEKVYRPLLNTDAITDNISLAGSEQDEFFRRSTRDAAVVAGEGISGDNQEETYTFKTGTAGTNNLAELAVVPGSIEEAADALAIIYSLIRLRGGDVHDFIRSYTQRDIANLQDILGTYGLEFGDDGDVVVDPDTEAPVEGFHSRAYGDYNADVRLTTREGLDLKDSTIQAGKDALKALFPGVATGESVIRGKIINKNHKTAIRPELDPRGRARARVMAYVSELELSRGLMG
jgi:hypothetical protein